MIILMIIINIVMVTLIPKDFKMYSNNYKQLAITLYHKFSSLRKVADLFTESKSSFCLSLYKRRKKMNNSANYNYEYAMNGSTNAPDAGAPCVDYSDFIGLSPATTTGGVGPTRSDTFMSFDDNIRSVSDCNTIPWLGPAPTVPSTGAILQNWYVNETDRGTVAPENVEQINVNRQGDGQTFITWADVAKTTVRETTEYAYAGNPNKHKTGFVTSDLWQDLPKTSMKETTEFAYTANPNRAKDGQTFISWSDPLKTTTRETTEYSYVGSIAPATKKLDTSRFQFTGPDDEYEDTDNTGEETKTETFSNFKKTKAPKTGGAKAYSIRGATLITDYFPTPGRTNIIQDPDQAYGQIHFKKNDLTQNGPGTYLQSIPNATYQQNFQILATPRPDSNRLFAMDDRQIASYQVEQLKNNPLSIHTNNAGGIIPPLFAYNEPDTYTSMNPASPEEYNKLLEGQPGHSAGIGGLLPVSIYPLGGNQFTPDTDNPNMRIVDYNGWNPMISQGSSRNQKDPNFTGLAYSGKFIDNASVGGVYGPVDYSPIEDGMIGFENNTGVYCHGNDALSYAVDDYTINRNLY